MSTKQRSRRRETPTGMSGIDQPQKTRQTVLTNWEDICDGLPRPTNVWRWGETPMSHQCLCNLKEAGLIEPTSVEKHWRTTQTLWEYVQATALSVEMVGKTEK